MVQISGTPASPIRPQGPAAGNLNRLEANKGNTEYKTFSATMKDFLKDVNNLQEEAGKSVEKLLTGEIKDAHDVMIAGEKAAISFELMMELRNKMIEAYHEVMRMQV
ncbi:flagellar hook-basal body complex protein FliE [candidate division KSB1 bacterium]